MFNNPFRSKLCLSKVFSSVLFRGVPFPGIPICMDFCVWVVRLQKETQLGFETPKQHAFVVHIGGGGGVGLLVSLSVLRHDLVRLALFCLVIHIQSIQSICVRALHNTNTSVPVVEVAHIWPLHVSYIAPNSDFLMGPFLGNI